MGAAESKQGIPGTAASEGSSKAKLTFPQNTQPLQVTTIYTLRDAYFGKRLVSAFTYDPSQLELDNKQEFLPKAIKKLKTIRHPSVLRFIDCKASPAGFHLITERVVPLTVEYLEEITEDEILVGLYDIMVALHFLHSQCHISHNNVKIGSIFVSNGRWVLGGMEFTGTVAESRETGLTSLLSQELVPPEHQGKPAKTAQYIELLHAVDVWQYGKLVEKLVQDGLLHFGPTALPLDAMLQADPKRRPTGDAILEADLFLRNNSVSVVRYCRLKGLDKLQNAEWSQSIMPKLQMLSPSIMEKFVLPQLLTQEFFAAEGFDIVYRTLFTPQPPRPLISEETYRAQVMPFMIKLWTYRQADIRMTVFRLFEVYLKAVVLGEGGSEVLGQIILPEILAGLQDADPKVYLASLSGLATAIPYALLVTTLSDADLTKQKFSVKTLYEQTLIPQIMAFWIAEDSTQEARMQLVEVVMGMWCSIYTLGLHNHAAVKDMSSTLTLTLVSVLKLSPVPERLELISKSFTKHCTNGAFCISGLLKFLPQFLLDEDIQVREAAARAISTVAHQTTTLVQPTDTAGEQQQASAGAEANGANQDSDASSTISTPSASPSAIHISRIRQYCEKQQMLLPARRPIFSRSAFGSDKSISASSSVRGLNGLDMRGSASNADLLSSRRSSIVSQDSFMFSEQSSLKTPSLTRTGSFSVEQPISRDPSVGFPLSDSTARLAVAQSAALSPVEPAYVERTPSLNNTQLDVDTQDAQEKVEEEDIQASDELELMKALEAAKEEMRLRQLPIETPAFRMPSNSFRSSESKPSSIKATVAFDWDNAGDDEGDDWEADDLTTLNNTSNHPPSSALEQPVEDEATRLKREQAQAEKQEQLRLKRDQKQQEMQAKRDARRQQMAEKQKERKVSSSNGLKLAAVKAAVVTTPVAGRPLPSASVSAPSASVVTPIASAPSSSASTTKPTSSRSISQLPRESIDENDGWGDDVNLDLGDLQEQAGTVVEDNELFKDLEVTYRKPAYVGATAPLQGPGSNGISGSTVSISSSNSSSITLANPVGTVSTIKTVHSPTSTFHSKTTTTTMSSKTTTTMTTPFSLKPSSSPSPPSRESSPASTPKRVASPLLSAASPSGVNGHRNGNGNGVAAGYTTKSLDNIISPTSASAATVAPEPLKPVSSSSLALQVDESALEEDGWGDDWD
ncbi:Protein-associating with the carboxyl-terminal domain of ezrin [Linnemannia schmuckeri]|uniref:Protein-associating with the carboxyl-terminal domain of ezrin n=1 Tax=Linnemannia schmuckeri TaxID=64567 RepID=A0A9P5VCT9_9FUNG|nr:Protein-associating with the carboxyl-terminal domain of ezrin [Linnemannia schmuckeri]